MFRGERKMGTSQLGLRNQFPVGIIQREEGKSEGKQGERGGRGLVARGRKEKTTPPLEGEEPCKGKNKCRSELDKT